MSPTDGSQSHVHVSVLGYQKAAEAYEHGRPSYPQAAVRHLVQALQIAPGKQVLEIGAGTGKFTQLLVPTQAVVIAVEPIEAMRARLKQALGQQVRVLDGTAEKIPLESTSVDAVVVAQAFHWFDGTAALAEIHRVLRPGGKLGLIWNTRDESSRLQRRLSEIINRYEEGTPRFTSGNWRTAFKQTTAFTALEKAEFAYEQRGSRTTVIDRTLSTSFIAALPSSERERVLQAVQEMLEEEREAQQPERITLKYRTCLFWCSWLPSTDCSGSR